jgi:ATP-dependent Clp protease protease subunit
MYNIPKITELIDALENNYGEAIKSFESILNLHSYFKREIVLGDIDSDVGGAVEAYIRFFNAVDEEENIPIKDRQPIKIFIDSGGGDLCATLTMIDAIKMSKTPVWTINVGAAYSGGFFTFISGHKRFAYPHSTFLYHEGHMEYGGDAGKFRNLTDFYTKKQLPMLKDITLKNTNISDELYEEKKRDDWWITADEALELGICDEITEKFV